MAGGRLWSSCCRRCSTVRRLAAEVEAAVHQAGVLNAEASGAPLSGLGVALEGVELVTSKETEPLGLAGLVGLKGLSDPKPKPSVCGRRLQGLVTGAYAARQLEFNVEGLGSAA